MYSCDWLVWLELSTPTNKLATYFGDDKPTSRSVGRWIGIGFACVKHCARGFTTASSRERWYLSRINHCEGAITAAISHDEQAFHRINYRADWFKS